MAGSLILASCGEFNIKSLRKEIYRTNHTASQPKQELYDSWYQHLLEHERPYKGSKYHIRLNILEFYL